MSKVASIVTKQFDGSPSHDINSDLLCLKVNEALKALGTPEWCEAKQKALIEYGVAAEILRIKEGCITEPGK